MSDLVALANYIKGLELRLSRLERQDRPVAGAGEGGLSFSDTEGNPADVAVVSGDGTSIYAARRDHIHTVGANTIDNGDMVDMYPALVKGRAVGAGVGPPTDLTAAQLVTILWTADGATSGLDADRLDGVEGSGYVPAARTVTGGAGLMGGGALSGDITLDIGAGNGITVNANDIQIADTVAGNGLTYTTGVLAVGAGEGITVAADVVALTTPGTLTVATTNAAAGNHTHAVTTSSNPGAAAAILASTSGGGLTLVNVAATTAVTAPEIHAADAAGLRIEDDGNNLGVFVEDATGDVGIKTATPTSALEVAGILTLSDTGDNNIVKIRPTASVAIAADAYITLPTTVGLVLINNASSGASALFMLRGAGGVAYEVSDPASLFSVNAATDNNVNCYWDSGSSTYRVNNTFATSRTCSIFIFGHTGLT